MTDRVRPPLNESERLAGRPLECERCGITAGAQLWDLQLWSPERLWVGWALCELCCRMVEDAIRLELAGAGPGGHVETPVATHATPPPTSTARVRRLDEQDPGRPE